MIKISKIIPVCSYLLILLKVTQKLIRRYLHTQPASCLKSKLLTTNSRQRLKYLRIYRVSTSQWPQCIFLLLYGNLFFIFIIFPLYHCISIFLFCFRCRHTAKECIRFAYVRRWASGRSLDPEPKLSTSS